MAKRAATVLSEAIRSAAAGHAAGPSDRELLGRFTGSGDQAAFAALFRRHAGMVLGVCRRTLANEQDAEDACQATFLLLSRKAGSGRWQPSVANWLYLTARRVARNARLAARRRARREGAAAVPEAVQPVDRMTGRELLAALDEELDRLPPSYREPLVLCYLEGLTRDEAALRLGLPPATLKTRLERGRKRLGDALTKRGCVLGAGLLALAATSPAGASPPRLLQAVLAAASGQVPAAVAALVRGGAVNGVMRKALIVALALSGAAVLAVGGAGLPSTSAEPPAKGQTPARPARPVPAAKADAARTISGRVVDPDDKPVAGARLLLCWMAPPEKRTPVEVATTAADGTFRCAIEPPEEGVLENRSLIARAPGFGADWVGVGELAADKPVTLRLVPDDVTVRGRVVDLQGKPVAGATVTVNSISATSPASLQALFGKWRRSGVGDDQAEVRGNRNFSPGAAGVPAQVVADADGRFEIRGVGRGRLLYLTFQGSGTATATARVAVLPGAIQGPAVRPVAMKQGSMPAASGAPALYGPEFTHAAEPDAVITGVVTDAKTGQPLAGVQVTGMLENGWWETSASTKTGADGRYRLTGLAKAAARRLQVRPSADSPYLMGGRAVRDEPGLAETTADVQLLRGVLVTGRVTDKATGEPVPGAAVRYRALTGNRFYAAMPDKEALQWTVIFRFTQEDGTFRFLALPGVGLVTAQGEIRGGKCLFRYAQVRLDPADEPRTDKVGRSRIGDAFLAADGALALLYLQSAYKVIDPAEGTDALKLELQYDPGKSTSGKVLDPAGSPAAGVEAYGLEIRPYEPRALKDGAFTATGLDPDRPRVVAFVDPERRLAGAVRLTGDEKEPPVVRLRPWGAVTGRVLDADGKPCAGVGVKPNLTGGDLHDGYRYLTAGTGATTDADGRFRLDVPFGGVAFRLDVFRDGRPLRPAGPPFEVRGFAQGESRALPDIVVKTE